jgi:hypothetical protein
MYMYSVASHVVLLPGTVNGTCSPITRYSTGVLLKGQVKQHKVYSTLYKIHSRFLLPNSSYILRAQMYEAGKWLGYVH